MFFYYLINKAPHRIKLSQWSSITRLYCHAANASGWDPQPWLSVDMKRDIERKWKQHVDSFGFTDNDSNPNTYILSMFPYPSGKLHMGHVRVYAISDTLARFYRMLGHNVLHPMGWDAFGLPAENAARQSGDDPIIWTENNINVMKSQLKQLGCSFDWDREFATCHPQYYKWTQYIFLQMYKAGLIYRKPSLVNWDPVDKTVLADEQVDENGYSWRSGAKVEKRLLTQWFVRATKFSSDLLKELPNFQKEDWADIVNLQKSWIGDVNGVCFDWNVEGKVTFKVTLPVWTEKPENVYDVSFIAVQPGSMLDVMQDTKSFQEYQYTTLDGNKEAFKAARLDFVACNPFSQEKVPIYVVDNMLPFPNGASSYMGVPSKINIDSVFAKCLGLPISKGSSLNESTTAESICRKAQEEGFGGFPTSSKLKDWLISRQRYWGTPIPIVHCVKCGTVPVPEDLLPVKLPPFPTQRENSDSISSPLAQAEEWVNTTCPRCSGPATRETDTMDTFVDSSWYYLRFIDPSNNNQIVSLEKAKKFMPVSVYIGGKEHATLHLYYARIVSHFLHQLGITPCPEPFQRLLVQGMVMGQTFLEKDTGRYLKRSEVEFQGKTPVCIATGKPVVMRWDKMSKSKHNGVDPADAISSFGIDTTRLFMLADAAPFSQRNWDPEGSKGVLNWQNNLYVLVSHFILIRQEAMLGKLKPNTSSPAFLDGENQLYLLRNEHLSIITYNYKITHQFFVSIKSMQKLTKKLKLLPKEIVAFSPKFEEALATLVTTLAPMAPHFASELWRGLVSAPRPSECSSSGVNWEKPVLHQPWPELDPEFHLPLSIHINTIKMSSTSIPHKLLKGISKDTLVEIALKQEEVKKIVGDKSFEVRHVVNFDEWGGRIFLHVPGLKMVSFKDKCMSSKQENQAQSKQKNKKTKISA